MVPCFVSSTMFHNVTTKEGLMPNNRANAVPSRLAAARRQVGFTQEEVAERAGLSRTSIARYEAGLVSPSPVSLNMLAILYDRPVAWLLGEDGDDDTPLTTDPDYEADLELVMNEASLALRQVSDRLSPEAIKSIADYIRFVDEREERERREGEGQG